MKDIFNQYKEFKSFEVSFTDSIGKPYSLHSTIKSIDNDIMIISTKREIDSPRAKVGDLLYLKVVLDSGVYTATSNILEIEENSNYIDYSVDIPVETKHSQRREYYRADMPIEVEVSISQDIESVNADAPVDIEIAINSGSESTVIKSKTKNISGNGMCFISDQTIDKKDNVNIKILLKFSERTISTDAKLVYTKEFVNYLGNTIYLHAFSFTNISKYDTDFIVKKCFLHQLERRKQNRI